MRKNGENFTVAAFHGVAGIIAAGVHRRLQSSKTLAGLMGKFDQAWNPAFCQFFFVLTIVISKVLRVRQH
jgi:hypothetical protein